MTPRSLLSPAKLGGQPILRAQTDERLVELAREASRPAFEAIVSRYRRQILSYCARFLGQERAEDAVQQTFVKAYTALTAGEPVRTLRPWLYRIAHNTSLNMLRDRALHHEQLSDQIDGVERPDQAAERRQELAQVLAAVQALPARQRDAIVLRALEGRSYEQIASDLGVSHGAVRQLLSRARYGVRAGVAAVTPVGLLARIAAPFGDAPTVVLAESGAGSGSFVTGKICAAALAAAVAGGGVSTLPDKPDHQGASVRKASVTAPVRSVARAAGTATIARSSAGSSAARPSQSRVPAAPRSPARRAAPAADRERAARAPSTDESPRRRAGSGEPDSGRRRSPGERRQRQGEDPAQPAPVTSPSGSHDGGPDTRQLASAPPPSFDRLSGTPTETDRSGWDDGALRDGAR